MERIQEVQERLGRQLLVENPSWYAKARGSTLSEVAFLTALARRSGCGVLLDVNNLYVSSQNLGFDPCAFIDAFPARLVGEIHLAGHARRRVEGCEVLVDDHGSAVCEAVWALYARLLARGCRAPAVVEWETSVPPLPRLLEEVHRAQAVGNVMLREFQQEFISALLTPSEAPNPLRDGPVSAQAALAVYRNNVFAGFTRALQESYPVVVRLVGEAFFAQAARHFLEDKGFARTCSLSLFGAGFADFLETYPPAREVPYLGDMARLERAWLEAYHAAEDGETRLHPSVRLVHLGWPVLHVWEAHQSHHPLEEMTLKPHPTPLLVWRHNGRVHLTTPDETIIPLVEALLQEESLQASWASPEIGWLREKGLLRR